MFVKWSRSVGDAHHSILEFRSGEPPRKSDSSRFRVSGFGFRVSVSGFGFSSLETGFGFRVSGFGFRRLQPTFAAGFGFRVSGFEFRRLKPTFAVGFGFRVSRFCFWVSPLEINFRCRFRFSDFGFRRLQPTSTGFRFSLVDVIHFIVGFGFRVS